MTVARQRPRVGDLRPSQLLFTFGVGSIVELPHLSVMVLGLDLWNRAHLRDLPEPRLLAAVRRALGGQVERLCAPPIPEEGYDPGDPFDEAARIGVPVASFPGWLRCPSCNYLGPIASGLFELKTDLYRPDKDRYVHENCPKSSKTAAIPARFLVACDRGHLDDFPWSAFLHGGRPCDGALRMSEVGVSGLAGDVYVTCNKCDTKMSMAQAFEADARQLLGACRGRRVHLRDMEQEGCGRPQIPILLGASNSWFPILLSALSIPRENDPLGQAIEKLWADLQELTSEREVKLVQKFHPALSSFDSHAIWARIEEHQGADDGEAAEDQEEGADDDRELKLPEWQAFSKVDPARNGDDFLLHEADAPAPYAPWIERVVLVERLREVHALLGSIPMK